MSCCTRCARIDSIGRNRRKRFRQTSPWLPPAKGVAFAGCASGRGGSLAEEQVRRQDVERLELAGDVAEGALQVRERARGELEDEERAPRREHRAGLVQDALAQR